MNKVNVGDQVAVGTATGDRAEGKVTEVGNNAGVFFVQIEKVNGRPKSPASYPIPVVFVEGDLLGDQEIRT